MPAPAFSLFPQTPNARANQATKRHTIRRPARVALGTQSAEPSLPKTRFARSESSADEMRLQTIRFMLDSEETRAAHAIAGPDEETQLYPMAAVSPSDADDWDDHTLVEIDLFLQPTW